MSHEVQHAKCEAATLVCFALKEEAASFRKLVTDNSEISILITGVGRQNAEKSIRDFLANRCGRANAPVSRPQDHLPDQARLARTLAPPSLVLTCGFAGGLNPDLKPGEVVFEVANAPLALSLSPPSGERVSVRTGEGLFSELSAAGAKRVKFFCADRIVITAAEKKKLRAETGADAVEMESEAIHAICRERGIPCATVRVISDTAHEDLPLDFNALAKPDKNLDFGKLAWAIAKSPGKIPKLMELQKKTKFAAQQLAAVLEKMILENQP